MIHGSGPTYTTRESSSSIPDVRSHGASIPSLGLGTWQLTGADARRMVERALELGYRHIDTAEAYDNHTEVGRAIEAADVPRSQVFLTTKIWPDHYDPDGFRAAVADALAALRTDHVDLLLLHWPRFENASLERTIELLNEALAGGRTRHIGVSNFTEDLLARAEENSSAPLVVNQVEYHPFLDQTPVLDAVREREMALTAYSPLARGRAVDEPTLGAIGERYGKSAAQVALRWLVQQDGVAAVPKSSSAGHARENLDVFDFELTPEESRRIAELADPDGRVIDPAGLAPDWD